MPSGIVVHKLGAGLGKVCGLSTCLDRKVSEVEEKSHTFNKLFSIYPTVLTQFSTLFNIFQQVLDGLFYTLCTGTNTTTTIFIYNKHRRSGR